MTVLLSSKHLLLAALCQALVLSASCFAPILASPLTKLHRGFTSLKMGVEEPAKVHELRTADPSLPYVDVRTPEEYSKARPPGSVNMPAFSLPGPTPLKDEFMAAFTAKYTDKSAHVVVGCASGKRSGMACQWLADAGYTTVTDVNGGFGAWSSAGLPQES